MAQPHAHGRGIERGAVPGRADALAARREENRRRMVVAAAINAALLVAGVVGGILTGSLALLADAGHVLSDLGAIALALLAAALAARSGGPRRTFGYQRSEVMAALAQRPHPGGDRGADRGRGHRPVGRSPGGGGRRGARPGGGRAGRKRGGHLGARQGQRDDINLEAVLRHSAADALGSLGVIVSGAVILATGWEPIDPLVGIAIAALILASSVRLVREPLDVLMEAAPPGVDVEAVAPGDRLGGRRARGARPPRLVGDAGIRGACRPRGRRPWARIAIAPGARSSSCFGTATGSSTRRFRWRRRPTTTPCSRFRPAELA